MQKKIEKKGTSGKEINKMATTNTRNVGSQTNNKNKVSTDPSKEEKIKKHMSWLRMQNREA